MIGFSFGHTWGVPFLLCYVTAALILALSLLRLLLLGGRKSGRRRLIHTVLTFLPVLLPLWIPNSLYLRWSFRAWGLGQHAPAYLEDATRDGDLGLVDDLRSAGVPGALAYAARGGRTDVVEHLLQEGESPDAREEWRHRTPLMEAVEKDHKEVVRILLERGADPSLTDDWGETALAVAVRFKREAIEEVLRAWKTKH